MKFVFVTCRLVMGGNEMLISRMGDWLISQGHSVSLIAAQGGFMRDKFNPSVDVFVVGSLSFGAAPLPFFPYKKEVKQSFRDADVVMSFSSGGCVFAYHLYRSVNSKAKLIAGVFHPNTCLPSEEFNYYSNVFWQSIHEGNRVYMNEAILGLHEEAGGVVNSSLVWVLPVGEISETVGKEAESSNVILSVGRLTSFKGYNLYMIRLIRELIDMGYSDLEWHVIGDDEPDTREPVKATMLEEIERLDLGDHIKFYGIVPEEELPKFFDRAKIFVGMGTSAVLASAHGVPTICAVCDDCEGLTYGYMWDQPAGCVGERLVNRKPDLRVIDLIKTVIDLEPDSYREFASKSRECAKIFSIDSQMVEFLDICSSVSPGFNKIPRGRLRFLMIKFIKQFKKRLGW